MYFHFLPGNWELGIVNWVGSWDLGTGHWELGWVQGPGNWELGIRNWDHDLLCYVRPVASSSPRGVRPEIFNSAMDRNLIHEP